MPRGRCRRRLLWLGGLVVLAILLGPPVRPAEGAPPSPGPRPLHDPLPLGYVEQVSEAVEAATAQQQALAENATLETLQPEVQWSPAGSTTWESVTGRETVRAGDRVRTGVGAAARLTYFDGTVTELGPSTGLLVQRLERTENGSLLGSFFQSVGTTISRVVQLVDPGAFFQVETPAATAFVRGTMPRIDVAANGTTRVSNVPDGTGGLVSVRGNDAAATTITLAPGQETLVTPGQPPSQPAPLGTYAAATGTLQQPAEGTGPSASQRQQQRQQRQQMLQQQVAQARAGLIAAEQELQAFALQEASLQRQIARLLSATPTPGISRQPPSGAPLTPLPPTQPALC